MTEQEKNLVSEAIEKLTLSGKIKTGKAIADGVANSGIIFGNINSGIDSKLFCNTLNNIVATISDRIARNGEKITEEIVTNLCSVVCDKVQCAVLDIKYEQKKSEQAIAQIMRDNFLSISEHIGTFAEEIYCKLEQILDKKFIRIEEALEQLARDYREYWIKAEENLIENLRLIIEESEDRIISAMTDLVAPLEKKLDDIREHITLKSFDSTNYNSQNNLPENEDFDLGYWYYCNGQYSQAIKLFYAASEKNHSIAQYLIGCCYYNGDGVKQDRKEAAKWFITAAKNGNSDALKAAGDCYYWGDGVSQDYRRAFEYYSEATRKHNVNAMFCLGVCYEKGLGIEPNILYAVEWYKKAADLDDPDGQFALGLCYFYEKGVVKDYRRAASLYFQAANSGHSGAQENYGECLEKGIGVAKNIIEAIKYYELAAKQGNKTAERAAHRLLLLRNKI